MEDNGKKNNATKETQ